MKGLLVIIAALAGLYFFWDYKNGEAGLKPKEADEPATGICEMQKGETVIVTISEDTTSPKCLKVKPDQKLKVFNNTDRFIKVWFKGVPAVNLHPSSVELRPDSQHIFGKPFSAYLEAGVHRLHVSPLSGSEIWLAK